MRINPERVLWVLIVAIAFLGFMHLFSRWVGFQGNENETLRAALSLFNVNHEVSIPTWFSQLLLLGAAGVALVNGVVLRQQARRYAAHWTAIAVILTFMSIDEGSGIHEITSEPLQRLLGTQGTLLHYAWVLVSGTIVIVVVLIFLRFWWHLPRRTRVLTFAAAATFVVGAIGFEVLGGYVTQNVSTGMKRAGVNMLEETFEMLGSTLAMYAFLTYLRQISPQNSILITGGRAQSDAREVKPTAGT